MRYSDIMKPKNVEQKESVEKAKTTKEVEVKKEVEMPAQPMPIEKTEKVIQSQVASKQYSSPEPSKSESGEAFIGKYIIGILASILVFIGTIYFVVLIWKYLTVEFKLSIISLVGIALSLVGFRLVRKKKNVITSIILGTGAGLIFIAILSANLAFQLIGNNVSILLVALWAVMFILSSRYTQMFLTTIIAYIGSYFTLLLGLSLMKADADLWALLMFATAISVLMLFTTYKEKSTEFLVSIICALVSYSTILVRSFFDGAFFTEPILNSYVSQTIILLLIYILMNMLFKLNDEKTKFPFYLICAPVITLLTIFFVSQLTYGPFKLGILEAYLIFFAINLIQLILNYVLYKRIYEGLTIYYAIVLAWTSMYINVKKFEVLTGIIIVALLLIICEKIFKRKAQPLLVGVLVLLDSVYLLFSSSSHLIITFYGLLQIFVIIYLLWDSIDRKVFTRINVFKIMALIVLMINSFVIPVNIIKFTDISYVSRYTGDAIGYVLAVVLILGLFKIGYFNDWRSKDFELATAASKTPRDFNMELVFYLLSTLLYFIGIDGIAFADKMVLRIIFILATIAITVLQTKVLSVNISGDMALYGLWFVIKHLILTWTILWSFSELSIASAAYSVIGLLISIICIALGFKYRIKSIRLYGLVLTIIMVAKFILVDLYEENSITKVAALILGGCLCFIISFIYNKASENYYE